MTANRMTAARVRIGSFLIFTGFQGVVITSAMFLTAMAANPLGGRLWRRYILRIMGGRRNCSRADQPHGCALGDLQTISTGN